MDASERDEYFMHLALKEAEKSRIKGEVPVGAVIIYKNKILSKAHNESIEMNDSTAHAEINAIRDACRKRKNYRILDCDLFVTLEPCAMCLGAAVHARIRRLVFGAPDLKGGAVKSVMEFPFEKMNHRIEIKGGVLEEECRDIIKDFFIDKR